MFGVRINLRSAVLGVLFLCAGLVPPVDAQPVPGLIAKQVASGLTLPIFVAAPPGDTNRLFIVQQTGQIRILNLATGVVNAAPFLNIQSSIVAGGEQGLLGFAFDLNYATNRKFYLNYTVAGGAFGQGVTHIAQYEASAGNPDVANTDPMTQKVVLMFDQPQGNHNGGWIGFSPRAGDTNNLYIASGDGGNGNDFGPGHIEPGGNAQSNTNLLGKMLRITINPTTGAYTNPVTNPYVGVAGARGEIFNLGLRNPFRCSFDRQTGDLFIGDVGQSLREEVSVQKNSNPNGGDNFGWRLREGFQQTPGAGIGGPPPLGNVDPIYDYPRSVGRTVIGGYVYRGSMIPTLQGVYVFSDNIGVGGPDNPDNRGRIFTLNYNGTTASNFQDITAELFPVPGQHTLSNPASFGEDASGELYICDIGAGKVYRIEPHLGITSITKPAGNILIDGFGVPLQTHKVQATESLLQPFMTIDTVPALGDGTIDYEDTDTAMFPQRRFYRLAYP